MEKERAENEPEKWWSGAAAVKDLGFDMILREEINNGFLMLGLIWSKHALYSKHVLYNICYWALF